MEKMDWKISVPIFKNSLILKQLGIAIGIPFLIVALIVGIASGKSIYLLYGLGLIAALLLLSWLLIMALYRGNYEVEFVLDGEGVLCRTQAKQAKKNRVVNALTVILGLFSGKPTVAGVGLLAQSRQEVFLRWNRVKKVGYQPKSQTILLQGGFGESLALFCTSENYDQAKTLVMDKTQHLKSTGSKA